MKLLAVRDVKNVNRLRPEERLTFGTDGVTVVFGFNGSGKSGYARLVKQMVRTRHREDILPNVFGAQQQIREGHLDYVVDGVAADADLAGLPPLPLGRVAFYDEKCGDAYLTTEAEIAYRPSVLTLLDDLYDVCEGVRREFDRMLGENARAAATMPALAPGSPTAAFAASLNADTSDSDIETACALPGDHESEATRLDAEEARLRSTNPEQEKARLNSAAGSAEAVSAHLMYLEQGLGDYAVTALRGLDVVAREKRAAASMASTASFDGEPVGGVGTSTWRALWDAARRFSEAEAYPAETYPHTGEAAHCVLCQQQLSGDASQRLNRFESFLADDTEQQAERAEGDLARALSIIKAVEVDPAAVAVAAAALEQDHAGLKAKVDSTLGVFRTRQHGLAAHPLRELLPGVEVTGLVSELDRLAGELRTEARAIDAGDFAVKIEEVANQRRDLGARIVLAGAKDMLIAERDRLLARRCIEEARKQTATTGLTTKVGELTRKYVTIAVQDRFSRESERLRVEGVTLQDKKGRQGALLHRPDFIGTTLGAELPQVLSEGEQTALGLAGFFTEAHFDQSRSSLVLDDPVTSLDHERRGRVAERLVDLAKERQVIVFTHDATFAAEIKRCAGEEEIEFTARTIERGRPDQQPGACRDDHPWAVKDAPGRLGWLKQDLVRIKSNAAGWDSETYDREVAMWAGNLSETWERFISQNVADALVNRGTLEVQVTMMKVVARITDEDNKQFQESYKRCSRWARRHDKDAALIYSAPPIEDLEKEHALVQEWFDRVRKYKA
ncbi:AAA family ATPase [Nocardioides sp. T2.26MG-1]|uniref:AAA family ATPase n=1 Tax=Nocardioides sp. T2.26MG-1 TaxID=3041166 RepID=UPI002477863A|nr:hypothetical protein [Nocardioides sp. T2.26MG-1]CAI9419343.1 hypothetical protein HIDPHFAB_03645 [Nocardioides sp. T2.26MG-1]